MRKILFRGRRSNGEWVYGSLVRITDRYCYIHSVTGMFELEESVIIPESVGQYTGLCDKNGKKIFEGDIVRFGKNIYQIIFSCGSFALYDEQGEMISKIGGINDHCYSLMRLYIECCWEDGWAYDVEIIGNIHDHPELLKGGEEE